MKDIDEVEKQFSKKELMTPEGIAEYAHALIDVQRKEQAPIMADLKEKQEYFHCDDDNKELFAQIVSGYKFKTDDCLPELDDCYMQLVVKKSENGLGYDMSCTFCREKNGKIFWFSVAPADYFLMIQIMGNYSPKVIHSFAPYFFFQKDIIAIVDGVVKSQMKVIPARKKIKVLR